MSTRKPSRAQRALIENLIGGYGVAHRIGAPPPKTRIARTVAICEHEGWIGRNRDGYLVATDAGREAVKR